MNRDREIICEIISNMLGNPNKDKTYPVITAYNRLEFYIKSVRMEAIGWMYAYACIAADQERDIRLIEVPDIIDSALNNLEE